MHEKMQPHARTCTAGGSPGSPGSPGGRPRVASPAPGSPGRRRRSRWVVAFAAAAALALAAGSAWAYNYYSTNFNWYLDNPDAETFTLKTAGEMEAFSAIVNGEAPVDPDGDGDTDFADAVNFVGKTVQLAGNVNLLGSLRGYEFTPIGKDAGCAFAGTFEGNGYQVSGLKLVAGEKDGAQLGTQGAQNVGLFGVVSETGCLRNVNIGSTMSGESTVSVASDKAAVSAVGSLVGLCQGAVENCTSAASITVVWDDGSEGNGRDAQVVMENIGGIAGICDGNLSGSSFSGELEATSAANALTEGATTNAFVARNIGGVVGRSGGEDFAATGKDVPNGNAGGVAGCSNSGSVSVYTLGQGGTDRFGEVVEAKSESVGGVAGYACGNVSGCANSGNVLASGYNGEGDPFTTWATGEDRDAYENTSGGGVKVGGVVGSLRAGVSASGNAGSKDAGVVLKQAGDDPYITLDGCTNTGYVSGLNAVGGIVGTAGTFTTVTHCINGDVDADGTTDTTGYVRTTRWNKPNGGGICGQSLGTVSWSRNHAPVINTKIGYYCGGIVGGLFDYDESSIRVSDLPEIYGCYNTGQVTSWSSGAILGENNGYVHDCVALKDADPSNCLVYATSWAIVDNCVVACATADEAAALDDEQAEAFGGRVALNGGAALAVLNTQSMADGFDGNYYFIPTGTAKGFPVLDDEDYGRSSYDLSTLQLDVESDGEAPYTVAYDPVPSVTAKALIDGEWVDLIANVDFRVIADPAAEGQGVSDDTYHASIQGIGNYTGAYSGDALAYKLVKGKLENCTVMASSATYNRHAQNSPDVVLLDSGKVKIGSDQYRVVSVNDGSDCVKPGSYPVLVEATEDGNYEGTATGEYAIAMVSLLRDCDLIGFTWQNRVWYYDDSANLPYEVIPVLDGEGNLTYDENGCPVVQGGKTVVDEESGVHDTQATAKNTGEDGSTVYGMAIDYTGSSIEPDVIGVSWTYSYVDEETGEQRQATEILSAPKYSGSNLDAEVLTYYGTAADLSTLRQSPNIEIGEDTGAITVAHGTGISASQLFSNYWVVKFDIVSEETFDLTKATVERYGDYVQYKSDTEAPYVPALDVVVGGRELAVYTEYDYEVVKTTAKHGTPDAEPCFAEGHKVYYKLVSKTDDSVFEIEDPWIVQDFSMSSLSTTGVDLVVKGEIDFSEGDFSPADHFDEYAEVVVKKNGNRLKRGFDYKLTSVNESVNPYAAPDSLCYYAAISAADFKDTRGMVTGDASKTLRLNDDEDLLKVKNWTITQEFLDALSAQDKLAVTTSASGYFSRCNKLAWCSSGYTKEDVAAQLHLVFTYNSGMSMSPSYSLHPFIGVEKILDAEGHEVERLTDIGVYTLVLSKGFEAPYSNVAFDNVSIQVEVTAPQLSAAYNLGSYPYDWSSQGGGEYVNLQFSTNIFVSKSQKYAYTGQEVDLALELKDVLGNVISPSDYVVEAHGVDVGQYTDWSVSATEEAQAANRLAGRHQARSGERYQITKADITKENIEIRVPEASFTGAAVEPEVEFWDVSDLENPKKLAYKLGQDYTLTYENNVALASAGDENAPSVTIKTQGSNMKAATKTVNFSIVGDLLDVSAVDFQYGQKLVQGNSPVVLGSYQAADGTKIDLEQGQAFAVTVCADAEGANPVSELSALTPGTQVYYRIDGVSANSFTGTKVLGPVDVVAASDANSFARAQDADSALSVEVSPCTYTGAALTPSVTVKDGGAPLREGVDYTLAFENNVNAFVKAAAGADATGPVVKVTGINGYTSEGSFSFDIQPAALADVCTAVVADQTYTGAAICPDASAVQVSFDGQPLEASGNWQVKADGYGEGNVNVGTAAGMLTLVGVGNFAGELQVPFDIVGLALTASAFEMNVVDQTYTGEPIVPAPSDVAIANKATGAVLVAGTDYVVSGCANNLNAGTATLNVSGLGNYSGNMSGSFLIKQVSLTQSMVSIGASSYPLSKDGVKPVPTVTLGSKILPTSDYVVTYGENNNPGKGTVAVTPAEGGNLSGEAVTIEFDITDDIAAATVNVVTPGSYSASGVTPPVLEVLYGSPAAELAEGEDYEVEYSSDEAAGTMTARIVGLGRFDGSSQEFEYSVNGKSLAAADVTVEVEQGPVEVEPGSFAYEYTGGEVKPAVTVKDGGTELVEGVDYELAYESNVSAGKGKVRIAAKKGGNYAEFVEKTFDIAPVDVASQKVSITVQPKSAFAGALLEADVEVTHTPDVAVAYALGAKGAEPIELVLNRDFTLKYKNNDKPGLATVTIAGMGNYTGEVDETFPVEVDLKSASITPVKNVVFAGEPVDQAPEVKAGTYVLTPGVEYEVSYAAASGNGELDEDGLPCAPGSYLRKVSGMGGYVLGEVSEVFVVSAADDPSGDGNEPGNSDGSETNNSANPDGSASGSQAGSSTGDDQNVGGEGASQSLAKTGDFNLIAVPALMASVLCAVATLALSRRKEAGRR